MIRVGIAGADSPMSGELIRILVNHPDVELVAACSTRCKGTRIDRLHHGLAGECDLRFSEFMEAADIDVAFIDEHSELADRFRSNSLPEGLRVIDMSHGEIPRAESETAYGLSELNRRRLVREARKVVVPRSIAAVALIALIPLAENSMLRDGFTLEVECPDDIAVDAKLRAAEDEIRYWLSVIQPEFNGQVSLRHVGRSGEEADSVRGVRIAGLLPVRSDLTLVRQLYCERYDDHNFTFCGDFDMSFRQVEGTDKCLLQVRQAPEGLLRVEAIADSRLRGGAGDAVHAMNLMFGLCETTGLRLKANHFD